jgi:hypothetical protein
MKLVLASFLIVNQALSAPQDLLATGDNSDNRGIFGVDLHILISPDKIEGTLGLGS